MSQSNTDPDRLADALDRAAQADSAGDLRELLRAADKVRSAPKPALSGAAAARIEHAALNRFRAQRRAARSSNRVSFTQFAIALSIVLALITASAGTAAASANSLPGETLYPVKRFVERAQLSLAAGDQRAALHITFAESRLAEIETLSKRGGVPPGLVDDLAAETESALTAAQVLPVDQQTNVFSNIVSMIDHQQAVLAAVQAKAPGTAQAALAHAQLVSSRGKKTALEAIQKIKHAPPGQQKTPPGQARTPPGQRRTPTAQITNTPAPLATKTPPPPSQTRTPPGQQQTVPGQQQTPPGQQNTPPGQQQTPPGQQQTPPGQQQTPPGQEQTPPGQEQTPPGQQQTPPGQEQTPPGQQQTPPGQQQSAPGQQQTPPGQQQSAPGQQQTPPGQGQAPPGQGQAPPGQGQSPPGQEQAPPGQGQSPPGQQQTPPGQSGDKGNAGGGKP